MILYLVSKIILVFVLALALVFLLIRLKEPVHFHAGFQVYKDDVLQDYSGLEYMHVKPCGEDEHSGLSAEEEQIEKAHLHDNNGNVVHVHREGVVWGDLFRNMKVEVNPQEVYVNGRIFEGNFLDYPIKAFDSIVIFEGENTGVEEKLVNAVTKEYIVQAEKKSENCGN